MKPFFDLTRNSAALRPADAQNRNTASAFLAPALAAVLFILLGAALIPYAGLEDDEVLFSPPLYPHWAPVTMVATYVGTLKTQLYWPIFKIFGGGVWSVRLPMVIAGALTLWICFLLARRGSGQFAAAAAGFLLATDPVFLLANTFDRGPVALHLLLLVAGCWLLARSAEENGVLATRLIALAFFGFGLATWSKAVFGWSLAGLMAGGLAAFWPEVRRALQPRNVVAAAVAFVLGALPVIVFNLRHVNATLGDNAHLEAWSNIRYKTAVLRNTANGSFFAEDFVSKENSASPKAATSLRGRAAAWIRDHLGEHRQTGFAYLILALLVAAAPWWWRSRTARFSVFFMAGSWAVTVATRGAGTYSSHIILLWPFPELFAACTLAALPWRRLSIVAVVAIIGMNLLVFSQYLSQYERNGPDLRFTDAISPLSAALPENTGQTIYIVDWNLHNQLELLHKGRLLLRNVNFPLLTATPSEEEVGAIKAMVSDRGALFVAHVEPRARVLSQRLERVADSMGYRRETLRTIVDTNWRPTFAIFRLAPPAQ